MKKISTLLIIITVLLTINTSCFALADSADCACVINGVTGEVIFSKNINGKHAMASTTKIMTALVALENSSPDEVVTVSANAASQEGSGAYVEENMEVYMRDMLYGLMLNSGNDAAVAIAEHISGDVDSFVELMNERAYSLGAVSTHFVNPSGLPDDAHYTTASDLALIARRAMKDPEFREIVRTLTYVAQPLNSETLLYFYNHNKMFEYYPDVTGIKTGYTDAAGRCLVSSAMRDNMEFIAVTLGDNEDWDDHAELLDYAFSLYYPKNVVESGMVVRVAKVDGREYNMLAAGDFIIPFKENGRTEVEVVTHISPELTSPVNAGEKTGYIEINMNGETVGEVDIISEKDIPSVSGLRLRDSFYRTFMGVVRRILV